MSKKREQDDLKTATVDVRGVEPDVKTDSAINIWIEKQRENGRKFKKGQAVVELAKIGLQIEGEIL